MGFDCGCLIQVQLPNLPDSCNTTIGRPGDCLIFDRIINLKMKKLNISSHQRRSTRTFPGPGVFSFYLREGNLSGSKQIRRLSLSAQEGD